MAQSSESSELMEVDPHILSPVSESKQVQTTSNASDFNLSLATFTWLRRVGCISDADSHGSTLQLKDDTSSLQDKEAYAHELWLPLISIADFQVMLAAVPAHLRPQSTVAYNVSTTRLLDTIARLALEPSLTLQIMKQFRPVSPHLWGRWLDMLGLGDGEWRQDDSTERAGERQAVEKVYLAMIRVLPVFDNVFPFLTTLLRHPLLANALVPAASSSASALATPLLALYTLLQNAPHISTSTHTQTATRLPWSLPLAVEETMKSHPHRGTRCLAWRIYRAWYQFHGSTGEDLRERWVHAPEGNGYAPMPDYPAESREDYDAHFGPFSGLSDEEDLIQGWDNAVTGTARSVNGGFELRVRRRAVDPWVLPVLETHRINEQRQELFNETPTSSLSLSVETLQAFEAVAEQWRLLPIELSQCVVDVQGLLLFREGFIPSAVTVTSSSSSSSSKSEQSSKGPKPEPFIQTPSNSALLKTLALHVQKRLPVLVTSPPSSGKTSTITHLWQLMHSMPGKESLTPTAQARQRGLVVINLADRSLDSKSLLGSLSSAPTTSTSQAGTFTFIEGPLTRALRQGRWVVLSQIDQASVEILTVIKIVVERMRRAAEDTRTAGRAYGGGAVEEHGGVGVRVGGGEGRWVTAGKGFMLFATRSTDSLAEPAFFASGFWSEVRLPRLEGNEVRTIVEGRYPRVQKAGLAPALIEAWDKARTVSVKEGVHAGTVRSIGVRDLMRWCRRVEGMIPRDVAITSIGSNPILQEEIFTEARDVFLGSMPVPATLVLSPDATPRDRYSVVARLLAQTLSLSPERAEFVLRRRVPSFVEPTIDETDGIISTKEHFVRIGRVSLPYRPTRRKPSAASRTYAHTNPSLIVLEKLAVCLRLSEPVLMVGETGTGKTAAVGHLAEKMGKRLTALNLSNQTEAGDLVGGFRPIDEVEEARRTAAELVNRFVDAFGQTFSLTRNAEFVSHVRKAYEKKRWHRLVGLWREAARMAADRIGTVESASTAPSTTEADAPRKRRKVETPKAENLPALWRDFVEAVGDFDLRHVQKAGKSKFVFSFVEGPLAKAIRDGDWVLLDEVNLASAETLESLSTLLQAPDSSLVLTEQGDLEPIPRHPEFRLFACMNPATDVGKRDLPAGLRAKFSEIWVPPPDEDRDALVKIVEGYIGRQATSDLPVIGHVADLYSAVKALAINAQLADGANQPPHFSMRTLSRALTFAAEHAEGFGHLRRALYEGFLMSFTMLLEPKSQEVVNSLIHKHIVEPARNAKSLLKQRVKRMDPTVNAIFIDPYWLPTGDQTPFEPRDYILTASVQRKVCDLARAVLTRKVPVLIQGPTSAGKTSVVEYLAQRTGHRFVRINNHEHTDIQEYIGTYVSDPDSGKLVFQEGVLVRALRRGDWIVLDELNLAPTDVLEALNRLLDDNRELLIPETGEVVRPHPHFMLFATQNPPGLYGGRKVLSRAFRNRFLELHFGDVPKHELETILCERCQIAPSYAKKTVAVFVELQRRRQAGRVFEQKHAFATLRDLFRWGGRGAVGYQQLAEDGYMLLAERARRLDDKAVVKEVIETEMKVKIDEATLYDFDRLETIGLPDPRPRARQLESHNDGDSPMVEQGADEASVTSESDLVWTGAMRRLYFLIAAALKRNEPVLLVGETGAGKTSVCQALAAALHTRLHIVGCHQNTETADLLGGQRPLRNRASMQAALRVRASSMLLAAGQPPRAVDEDFDDLVAAVEAYGKTAPESDQAAARELYEQMRKSTALFEWHDGPLVQAMHNGALILLDEISLADDSVLERLNSVLEPSRTLVLAEKGGRDLADIQVKAEQGFQILATMNPGGDFGKKELSPALRNRFTEIWVPGVDNLDDLGLIIGSRWSPEAVLELSPFGSKILEFAQWFGRAVGSTDALGIGLRDILGWIDFLNKASTFAINESSPDSEAAAAGTRLSLPDAFAQGALMTVVDGLGALPLTSGLSKEGLSRLRTSCWRYLETLVATTMAPESVSLEVVETVDRFSVGPFGVSRGSLPAASVEFTLLAPTTRLNAMRLLRALQLKKPVLLEGSPGVGKTSLVTALAAATGHHLVRINLSDQTDLMDLLGSDLPVEGGKSGEFAWKDAPFLAAMQAGDWVLLDEMNLASQSILEGLNSCLDHRGAVFIPELDRTFTRHPDFRIFAAQNPLGQGGGRKGLPRSFLDRFSVVHMEELNSLDLNAIAKALYPDVEPAVLERMIAFNSSIHHQTMDSRSFGLEGSPWEFNLRDVLRWLSLMRSSGGLDTRQGESIEYVGLLYIQRFRNAKDRAHVARVFSEYFNEIIDPTQRPWPSLNSRFAQVGHSLVDRSDSTINGRQAGSSIVKPHALPAMEALMKCLDMGWLAILTGARGSGKTSLVRQVAKLQGRRLREFSMSAEVDTLELLGSFEQAERTREMDSIVVDALAILDQAVLMQGAQRESHDVHASIAILRQLRVELSSSGFDVDLVEAASTVRQVLTNTTAAPLESLVQDVSQRLDSAAKALPTSARFEWVDGPLIRAMRNGDWLLVEDANLCSPSVLDRLNSLFETGGRLQLAERGPVNGEIQIIEPHPDFRLVMTLDPRNGELSRAMRNRGIEIALIEDDNAPDTTSESSLSTDCSAVLSLAAVVHSQVRQACPSSLTTPAAPLDLDEPIFESIRIALIPPLGQNITTAHHLISSSSRSQHGLIARIVKCMRLQNARELDFAIRSLNTHPWMDVVEGSKRADAEVLQIAQSLLLGQPLDISLVPHRPQAAASRAFSSIASDAVLAALLSTVTQPHLVREIMAKPVRSLDVWEKSLLVSKGKLRLEYTDEALLSLYPVTAALLEAVNRLCAALDGTYPADSRTEALPNTARSSRSRNGQLADAAPDSESDDSYTDDDDSLAGESKTQQHIAYTVSRLQILAIELREVSTGLELDFSSVQHVATWIAEALNKVPTPLTHLVEDASKKLAPLQSSLKLTSGKAMAEIWRAFLPYQPGHTTLIQAYRTLSELAATRTAENWDNELLDLFLDIVGSLGVPRRDSREDYLFAKETPRLVASLLDRIPGPSPPKDAEHGIVMALNADGVIVAELSCVASVLSGQDDVRAAGSTLTKVTSKSGVVPISSIVPLHQLLSWPRNSRHSRVSAEFKTIAAWSERLALGIEAGKDASLASIIQPTLLRAVVQLQIVDSSTLGNLVSLSNALKRAAAIQAWTAGRDYGSRTENLFEILAASMATIMGYQHRTNGHDSETVHDFLHLQWYQSYGALKEAIELHLADDCHLFLSELGVPDQEIGPALSHKRVEPTLKSVATGYVAVARCLLHLYLPNIPLDPAVGLRAHYDFSRRQLSRLSNLSGVTEASEAYLTGNGTNSKIQRLKQEIISLRQQLDESDDVPIIREGNSALLAALFQELRAFKEQIISDVQLDQLVQAMSHQRPTSELANRQENLQRSIETLLKRLDAAYADLADILAPIRLALCFIKIGFSLLMQSCLNDAAPTNLLAFDKLVSNLVGFPTIAHTSIISSLNLPASNKTGESPLQPTKGTLLQLTALSSVLANHAAFDRGAIHRLTQFYDRLHYLWSVDRKHEEDAAREAASLYKAKTDIQQIASDEELDAAEFAKMFPSFETRDEDTEAPGSSNVSATSSSSRLVQSADSLALARLHVGLFTSINGRVGVDCSQEYDKLRHSSVCTLLPKLFETLDDVVDQKSAFYRIRTLVELGQATTSEGVDGALHHNFYTEPSVRQTAKAVPLLQALRTRLTGLIATFPDQMVLQNLRDRCDTVLALSSRSPIAQVLTSLEQLLQHTEDWESFASREHSLSAERTALIGLIVEWRRFELKCWSTLLSTVGEKFNEPVAEWWFRLYETAIRGAPGVDVHVDDMPTESTSYYKDLVGLLNTFLSDSSLGQYKGRLELVLAFANYAAKLGADDAMPGAESLRRVSRLMLNVHAFYSQYLSRIDAFLGTERRKIEKDVQDLIKLASWKDVNVYALRQSAVKSHHMLYKAVRKLRTVLQKPASDCFIVGDAEKTVTTQFIHGPILVPSTGALPATHASLVSDPEPTHLLRLDQTFDRFVRLATSDIDPRLTRDRHTLVDDFAIEIITTAKSLRAESVAGEEDGREQRVKSLATRKRRMWIELLRELKRQGLSPSPAPEVVTRLRDPAFIYSLPASWSLIADEATQLDETVRQQLKNADAYHYRVLAELPALYDCPANHHEDISTREVQRAIGSIESNLYTSLDHRSQLLVAFAQHRRLEDAAIRFGNAALDQSNWHARDLARALLERVCNLLEALAEVRSGLGNHRTAVGEASDAVASALRDINASSVELEAYQDRLFQSHSRMSFSTLILATTDEMELLTQAREEIDRVEHALVQDSYEPELDYLFTPFRDWVASLDPDIFADECTSPPVTLSTLKSAHDSLLDSILVVMQELKKMSDTPAKALPMDGGQDETPDLTIKIDGRELLQTLAIFRFEQFADQVSAFAVLAHGHLASTNREAQLIAATFLKRIAPFLQTLTELAKRHLESSLAWHKASLKLTYVLISVVKELSTDGFCRPAEDDGIGGQDNADGKTSDGTGMADGQGAKNVSKDIEDESQIEGLQNDVEQEKEKNEQPEDDGDDDAVEMSGDFEGEMEDRGDGEKEDKEDGEEEDDEDQPEPEEQIADVDPLDPSSVDEKFWGDDEKSADDSKKGANEEINQETTKTGESEMTAKEDDAQAQPQPKGDDPADEQSADKEESRDDVGKEDGAERDEREGEQEDEGGEVEEDEDGEGDQDGDAAHQEDVERLDDRMPEADNLELPDDMKLDGDDDKQAEDDDLDMGSEMDHLDDVIDEGENQKMPDELDETSETEKEEPAEDALANPDDTNLEPEASEPKPEDDPAIDQSLGGAQDGQTGGEGAQDSAASAQKESEAAPEVSKQPGAQDTAQDSTELDDALNADDDVDMDQDEQDLEAAQCAPSASAKGKAQQRSSAADPVSDPSLPRPNQSRDDSQRSLGDALQAWKRRLDAIGDSTPEDQPAADLDAPKSNEQGEVEFVEEGDERDNDDQALGPAKEDQVQALEKLRIGEEEAEPTFQPDQNEIEADNDTTNATSSAPTTMQLQGSSLTETEAKAIPASDIRPDATAADHDEEDFDIIRADEADDAGPSTTSAMPAVDDEEDAKVEQAMLHWRNGKDPTMNAEDVWRLYESLTRDLSFALTEQLRLILEPTLATRLKGDYRSGKRLNLKKIIPYIASEFTKDKIWLRRTRPSQREYQVLIAIDDSKSMADSHSVHLAFQSLALISRALTRLEVGGVSINRFGETVDVLHPFENGGVSDEAGASVLSKFTFSQKSTDVALLVQTSLADLLKARNESSSTTASGVWSLALIVSDGLCQDHERLRALLRKAKEERVIFVFLVVDSLHRGAADGGNSSSEQSILNMQSVQYANGQLSMRRYIDDFPFESFIVLRDAEALPEVLSSTLRQFFERSSE